MRDYLFIVSPQVLDPLGDGRSQFHQDPHLLLANPVQCIGHEPHDMVPIKGRLFNYLRDIDLGYCNLRAPHIHCGGFGLLSFLRPETLTLGFKAVWISLVSCMVNCRSASVADQHFIREFLGKEPLVNHNPMGDSLNRSLFSPVNEPLHCSPARMIKRYRGYSAHMLCGLSIKWRRNPKTAVNLFQRAD